MTDVLRILYRMPVLYTISFVIVAFHIYFYIYFQKPVVHIGSIAGPGFIFVYALLSLTSFFHELGHSSACHYFGAKHGDIGIGLYLYFVVFYADVTDVWKLKRIDRATVDFGGIYFQLICVLVLFTIYVLWRDVLMVEAIYAVDFAVIASMNPFFRFDGYWVVSDLSGVSNLRQRSQQIVKYIFGKLRGRISVPPPSLPIESKAKYFLGFYSLVSNLFFGFFIYSIFFSFPSLISSYSSIAGNSIVGIVHAIGVLDFWGVLHNLSVIFFPTVMVLMIGMMFYRGIKAIVKYFIKVTHHLPSTKFSFTK
ncbi:MAG: hypothetical protein M1470_07240 [Bacteroidetes bacterium]|nr:hypothetical protein [Bacteroidota bacterium]